MAVRLKITGDKTKRSAPSSNHQNGTNAQTGEAGEKRHVTAATESKKFQEPVVVRVHRTVKQDGDRENQQESVDQDGAPKREDKDVETEIIEVRPFITQPAIVQYNYEVTRAVRYQSVTLGVQVSLPCYKEEVEDAVEEAKQICVRRLKKETKSLGDVLDYLVEMRNKAEQSLNQRGMP